MLSFQHVYTLCRCVSKLRQWPTTTESKITLLFKWAFKQNTKSKIDEKVEITLFSSHVFLITILLGYFWMHVSRWETRRKKQSYKSNSCELLAFLYFTLVIYSQMTIKSTEQFDSLSYMLQWWWLIYKDQCTSYCELCSMLLVIPWGKYAQLMMESEEPTSK